MPNYPVNLQQRVTINQPKVSGPSIVLEAPYAVGVMDFFGTAVLQQQSAIGAAVQEILAGIAAPQDGAQLETVLNTAIERANTQIYQTRQPGTNQGGSIVLATVTQNETQSATLSILAYGDCHIWLLRQGTVTQLDAGRSVSYLGSYRLNPRALFSNDGKIALEPGDRILLTTGRITADGIKDHADKTSKRLLNDIGKTNDQDALTLLAWNYKDISLTQQSRQSIGKIVEQGKTRLSTKTLITLSALLLSIMIVIFSQPLLSRLASPFLPVKATAAPKPTDMPIAKTTLLPITTAIPLTETAPETAPTESIATVATPKVEVIPTIEPEETPLPAMAKRGPALTPVPTLVPAPIPLPPAPPPTLDITESGPVATNSAPSTEDQPRIKLSNLSDGAEGDGKRIFRWETDIKPADGQSFELVFWKTGEDPLTSSFGVAAPTDNTQITVDLAALDDMGGLEPGTYQWGVLLVNREPYKRIAFLGGGYSFEYKREETKDDPISTNTPVPSTNTPVTPAITPPTPNDESPAPTSGGNSNGPID